jgi:hypothetical protein
MEELLRVERDGASNSSSSSQAQALRAESRIAKAVTPMKFWFMGEIVTDGVGHWRTYGEKKNLLTQRSLRVGRGAQNKGIKVGLDAKWGGFKVWI